MIFYWPTHAAFTSKSHADQRQWIYDYLSTHCPNQDGTKQPSGMQFVICGKPVCQPLWLATLGISTSRFYDLRKQYLEGVGPAQKKQRSLSAKSLAAISWMRNYFDKIGDKRPDKDGIYLPTCLTESTIYAWLIEEIGIGDDLDKICFSQFNRLFRQHFPNVTIPKESRFTKCNFCTLHKNETFKPSVSVPEEKWLKELLIDHLKLQEQERACYYSNRQKAVDDPDTYLSIIIDGMDQNKTNLPSFVRSTKSCQNLWCLRTHLTSCLVHGFGSCSFFYFLQFSHDSNLTITCMLLTLVTILKERSKLPRRLLLQMDNCVRENKNKYIFGFLAYLVQLEFFSEIELGFLMVGHTHEDIDQSFSCLSRYLRKNDALSMSEMELALKASNRNVKAISTLTHVFDVKKWILPHLDEIHGHTTPHIFRFRLNITTKRAEMHYRHWSSDPWEPKEGHGLYLLKSVPSGMPNCIQPNLDKVDLAHLKSDLPKYVNAGVIGEAGEIWWKEFLSSFEAKYGVVPLVPSWPLDSLNRGNSAVQPSDVHISEKISSIHADQMGNRPKIQVGKPATKVSQRKKMVPQHEKSTSVCSSALKPHDLLTKIKVGDYVVMKIMQYRDELPQIGKVKDINSSTVSIDWLIGSYSGVFSHWKEKGQVIRETFPLRGIMSPVKLTTSMRLQKGDIIKLKENYISAEFV